MLKLWWNRRKIVSRAKELLSTARGRLTKAVRKHRVAEDDAKRIDSMLVGLDGLLRTKPVDVKAVENADAQLRVVLAQTGVLSPRHVAFMYVQSIAWAVGIALLIRAFLFEPFKIPTGSMIPSLLIDDFIFVSKYSYGVKLPFASNYLVRWSDVDRGDVVVFPYPVKGTPDYDKDFIKRVVGLPGDRLRLRDNVLYVNDTPIQTQKLGEPFACAGPMGMTCRCQLQQEVMGDHEFVTQHFAPGTSCFNRSEWRTPRQGDFVVPEGHVFVMGDNRDNSSDGRFWGEDGQLEDPEMKGRSVPIDLLKGRARIIWLASDMSRIFSSIP